MVLCSRCFFQNDDGATVCAGPGCAECLPNMQPVCRIHRLPEGATVCPICAAQASARPSPARVGGPTHGFFPGVMNPAAAPRPVDMKPLVVPRRGPVTIVLPDDSPQTAYAPPPAVGVRSPTVDDRQPRPAAAPQPLSPRHPETPPRERAAEPARRILPGIPAAETLRRRETVNLSPGRAPTPHTSSQPVARLIGFLVTYSWAPEGQVFPLREGLNRIGAAPECEVSVPEDDALSSIHASIRFRSRFLINDLDSRNGTLVNGTALDESYLRVENYARIQTGKTVWTFIMIEPPALDESGMRAENI